MCEYRCRSEGLALRTAQGFGEFVLFAAHPSNDNYNNDKNGYHCFDNDVDIHDTNDDSRSNQVRKSSPQNNRYNPLLTTSTA